jgi:hypothetical protein
MFVDLSLRDGDLERPTRKIEAVCPVEIADDSLPNLGVTRQSE